eukprot:CAMPEP_0115359054 /NCGR_PEP_ID=MMETSP0270-20121206/100974_1 /TAXON_ID=71861 /ORGANISM="Scrippsiella trochoidea, Strain CCMP3099" /LENGTH=107 /DNA_ID=CAMNT_0002781547 /DNA_START=68 /DNA_END=389 /DNA_ORIENTATION=+
MRKGSGCTLGDSISLASEILHLLTPVARAEEVSATGSPLVQQPVLPLVGVENETPLRYAQVMYIASNGFALRDCSAVCSNTSDALTYLSKLLKSWVDVVAPDLRDGQ